MPSSAARTCVYGQTPVRCLVQLLLCVKLVHGQQHTHHMQEGLGFHDSCNLLDELLGHRAGPVPLQAAHRAMCQCYASSCNNPQTQLTVYLSVEQQRIEVVKQPLLQVMALCFADGAW